MILINKKWTKKEGLEFIKYLESIQIKEKQEWSKNLLNTGMSVLAIPTPVIKSISKEILKGNYISFLDLKLNNYFENTVVNGILITNIEDFDLMKKYLDKYVENIDNWASCDLLSFNVINKESKFYNLALEYISSNKPFIKRVGLSILFKYINNDSYIDKIFNILNTFYDEKEYYVNMMIAWLLCECFIKQREETLKFLKTNKLNKFAINKAVSKCRDSYRVSKKDKELLLKYRIK